MGRHSGEPHPVPEGYGERLSPSWWWGGNPQSGTGELRLFPDESLDPDDTCVWTFGPFLVDVPLPDEDQT